MSPFLREWLNVVLRWAHVTAAIMWIGDSFLFAWMDSALQRPSPDRAADVAGELWMIHSGGFYEVVKHRNPSAVPARLHWFMWESYATWISGVLLLTVVYALGGRAMLLDGASTATQGAALAVVLVTLVGGVLAYEGLCRVPALRGPRLAATGLALATLLGWSLLRVLSARAAFLLVGATLGTIMTANVFRVIIPVQRQMVDAVRNGEPASQARAAWAGERSRHNHFLTLPVLFTMLSNHFPALWGGPHAWAVLPLMFAVGGGTKWFMNRGSRTPLPAVIGTLASLAAVVALTLPPAPGPAVRALGRHAPVPDAEARLVVQMRCVTCHSAHPSNAAFASPPNGVTFETVEQMRAFADRIVYRVVETRTMPLGNLTGITEDERATLGAWAWRQDHR